MAATVAVVVVVACSVVEVWVEVLGTIELVLEVDLCKVVWRLDVTATLGVVSILVVVVVTDVV